MDDQTAREMARDLVRGSIIEDAAAQFIAQVLKHTHDSRIKPLQKRIEELEAKLAKAVEALEAIYEIASEPAETDHKNVRGWIEVTAISTLAELTGGNDE